MIVKYICTFILLVATNCIKIKDLKKPITKNRSDHDVPKERYMLDLNNPSGHFLLLDGASAQDVTKLIDSFRDEEYRDTDKLNLSFKFFKKKYKLKYPKTKVDLTSISKFRVPEKLDISHTNSQAASKEVLQINRVIDKDGNESPLYAIRSLEDLPLPTGRTCTLMVEKSKYNETIKKISQENVNLKYTITSKSEVDSSNFYHIAIKNNDFEMIASSLNSSQTIIFGNKNLNYESIMKKVNSDFESFDLILDRINQDKPIGKGVFGVVYKVQNVDEAPAYALKKMPVFDEDISRKISQESHLQSIKLDPYLSDLLRIELDQFKQVKSKKPTKKMIENEASIRKSIFEILMNQRQINLEEIAAINRGTCSDCLQYFGAVKKDNYVYLASELGVDNLSSSVKSGKLLTQDEILQIITQGKQLADKGIVNYDLKLENMMIIIGKDGRRNVKMMDFGMIDKNPITALTAGTRNTMAPEQFNNSHIPHGFLDRIHTFEIGKMILNGRLPLRVERKYRQAMIKHSQKGESFGPLLDDFNKNGYLTLEEIGILKNMLHPDITKRSSLSEVLEKWKLIQL